MTVRCSIIGSFRKYYDNVVELIDFFNKENIDVLSPKKSVILDPNQEFVLFHSDNPNHNDNEIQLIALNRILNSDFVFVCNPNGYIGKTTAYEIGRIIERKIPLYFQEIPLDIPIYLPDEAVISKEDLIVKLNKDNLLLNYYNYEKSSKFARELNENLFLSKFYE
jgi:hypothetical protein